MTLDEAYKLGIDPTWRGRCQTAGLQAAANVMAEDPSTEGHTERITYANRVMLNPSLESQAQAFGIAAQPGITGAAATDSDILFTTNALWNAWAGVGLAAGGA
jgi:hypothetical protein